MRYYKKTNRITKWIFYLWATYKDIWYDDFARGSRDAIDGINKNKQRNGDYHFDVFTYKPENQEEAVIVENYLIVHTASRWHESSIAQFIRVVTVLICILMFFTLISIPIVRQLNESDHERNKRVEETIKNCSCTVTIDKCEYIFVNYDRAIAITHKGNCTNCLKRNGK